MPDPLKGWLQCRIAAVADQAMAACRPAGVTRVNHDDQPADGTLPAWRLTPRSGIAGFSTIEVMVMVAIIALSLVPIMGVQSQVVRAYTSHKDRYTETTLVSNSLELITRMNPSETPGGSVELDSRNVLRWQSSPLSQAVRTTGYPSGNGDFQVTLYRTEATIETRSGEAVTRFSVDQLGWVKILKDGTLPPEAG